MIRRPLLRWELFEAAPDVLGATPANVSGALGPGRNLYALTDVTDPPTRTAARFEVYRRPLARPSQRWRWRLVHTNGRKLANGGEGYSDLPEAIRVGLGVCCGFYGLTAELLVPAVPS